MKHTLVAAITAIIALMLTIAYLLLGRFHGSISCNMRSTYNPIEAVRMEALDALPESAIEEIPSPKRARERSAGIALPGNQ